MCSTNRIVCSTGTHLEGVAKLAGSQPLISDPQLSERQRFLGCGDCDIDSSWLGILVLLAVQLVP